MAEQWQRDWRTLYILNSEGVNKFDMTVNGGQDDQGARVKYPACEEVAKDVLLALNAHAGLVEALEAVIASAFIPHDMSEHLAGNYAVDPAAMALVRAALAAARGETK